MISFAYTQQSVKDKKKTYLKPKGVFGLDVPLDKAHFYEYCEREIKRNFSELGVGEAKWIMNDYNEIYGGSPKEFPEKYIEASIYSNGIKNYLKSTKINEDIMLVHGDISSLNSLKSNLKPFFKNDLIVPGENWLLEIK